MAGGYNHIVTNKGNLVSNERFVGMIENLGDAYEMAEEMYGMIWFLAYMVQDAPAMTPAELVEHARQNHQAGLKLAKETKNKDKR
jgi:hypothetical protein